MTDLRKGITDGLDFKEIQETYFSTRSEESVKKKGAEILKSVLQSEKRKASFPKDCTVLTNWTDLHNLKLRRAVREGLTDVDAKQRWFSRFSDADFQRKMNAYRAQIDQQEESEQEGPSPSDQLFSEMEQQTAIPTSSADRDEMLHTQTTASSQSRALSPEVQVTPQPEQYTTDPTSSTGPEEMPQFAPTASSRNRARSPETEDTQQSELAAATSTPEEDPEESAAQVEPVVIPPHDFRTPLGLPDHEGLVTVGRPGSGLTCQYHPKLLLNDDQLWKEAARTVTDNSRVREAYLLKHLELQRWIAMSCHDTEEVKRFDAKEKDYLREFAEVRGEAPPNDEESDYGTMEDDDYEMEDFQPSESEYPDGVEHDRHFSEVEDEEDEESQSAAPIDNRVSEVVDDEEEEVNQSAAQTDGHVSEVDGVAEGANQSGAQIDDRVSEVDDDEEEEVNQNAAQTDDNVSDDEDEGDYDLPTAPPAESVEDTTALTDGQLQDLVQSGHSDHPAGPGDGDAEQVIGEGVGAPSNAPEQAQRDDREVMPPPTQVPNRDTGPSAETFAIRKKKKQNRRNNRRSRASANRRESASERSASVAPSIETPIAAPVEAPVEANPFAHINFHIPPPPRFREPSPPRRPLLPYASDEEDSESSSSSV